MDAAVRQCCVNLHNRIGKSNAIDLRSRRRMQTMINELYQSFYQTGLFPTPNFGKRPGTPLDGKTAARMRAFSPIASSWVEELGWDELTLTLAAKLKSKWYYWQLDNMDVYVAWARGLGVCRTNDPSGDNEWWIGKTPSLGAAFHAIKQYLVGRAV